MEFQLVPWTERRLTLAEPVAPNSEATKYHFSSGTRRMTLPNSRRGSASAKRGRRWSVTTVKKYVPPGTWARLQFGIVRHVLSIIESPSWPVEPALPYFQQCRDGRCVSFGQDEQMHMFRHEDKSNQSIAMTLRCSVDTFG